MAETEYDLGSAELEVLKVLWGEGPSTVRQVMNHLHRRGRRVAYTTVLTFLSRLEQKGFVQSDKSELAYVYRAAISRSRVTRSRLKQLLQQLYDGAAGPAVLQLVRTERLTPEEIEALQRLIEQQSNKRKRSKS
jgi:BlaI family penicillinase repressor